MAVLAIDGDLAKGEKPLHLAARFAPLWQLGHPVAITGQRADQVCSQAIDNAEVMAAREQRIPVVRRAEMLAELMRYRHGMTMSKRFHLSPAGLRPNLKRKFGIG